MARITCDVILDVSSEDSGIVIPAKKGDAGSRQLRVGLTACGEELLIDQENKVALAVRRGGTLKLFLGKVCDDGKAVFTIPNFVIEEEGTVSCEVVVVGPDESRLSSSAFVIETKEGVYGDVEIRYEEEEESILSSPMGVPFGGNNITITDTSVQIVFESNKVYRFQFDMQNYLESSTWKPVTLVLPTPEDTSCENRIVAHFNIPIRDFGNSPYFYYGENCVFADLGEPYFNNDNFDLEFIYLPDAGKWGVKYSTYE